MVPSTPLRILAFAGIFLAPALAITAGACPSAPSDFPTIRKGIKSSFQLIETNMGVLKGQIPSCGGAIGAIIAQAKYAEGQRKAQGSIDKAHLAGTQAENIFGKYERAMAALKSAEVKVADGAACQGASQAGLQSMDAASQPLLAMKSSLENSNAKKMLEAEWQQSESQFPGEVQQMKYCPPMAITALTNAHDALHRAVDYGTQLQAYITSEQCNLASERAKFAKMQCGDVNKEKASTITGTNHEKPVASAAAPVTTTGAAKSGLVVPPVVDPNAPPKATVPSVPAVPAVAAGADNTPANTAARRIASQSSYYTSAPPGVPAAEALSKCYADPCTRSQVREYQTAINQYITQNNLPLTPIAADGIAGTQTANAWRAVMGAYSSGPSSGSSYSSWGATPQTTPSGVYYTFPPAKITNPSQLKNFFE